MMGYVLAFGSPRTAKPWNVSGKNFSCEAATHFVQSLTMKAECPAALPYHC